ncbi:MAG: AsmA-like C-terminal region-containing protein [Pseudomonadota bacterium]
MKGPWLRPWVWVLGACVLAVLLAVFAGLTRLQAQPVPAPQWLVDRVNAQADALLPDTTLGFRSIRVGMDLQYHPQVYLDDVTVTQEGGLPIVDLRTVQGDLSVGALLGGEVELRRVELSGAVLKVRRDTDGNFDVALGQAGGGEAQQINEIEDVFGAVDRAFTAPELNGLREVVAEGITINYTDAASGQIWTGDGGQVRLFREGRGLLVTADAALLTGREDLAAISISVSREEATGAAVLSAVVEDAAAADIASQVPALAWLSAVDAPISVAFRARLEEAGLTNLSATLELGAGGLKPNPSTTPVPFSDALVTLEYDPEARRVRFNEFLLDTAWGQASAQGTAELQDFNGGLPREIVGQFRFNNLEGALGGLYAAPQRLDKVSADFRLRLDPFTLDIGQAVVVDGASTLLGTGQVTARREGWDVAVDLGVDDVAAPRIKELWPEAFRPGLRRWIVNNIEGGTVHQGRWSVRARPGEPLDISSSFHFSDGQLRILRSLPPVTGGRGTMVMHKHALSIIVEAGSMRAPQGGEIDATGTVFHVADLREKPSTAEVRLVAEGTVTAMLSVLDEEPFRFLTKANQPVTLADGRARAEGEIRWPMRGGLRGRDFTVDVAADLRNVRSSTLIEGKLLTMPRARAIVTNDIVSVAGEGSLGRVAFDGAWAQPIGQGSVGSEVRGTVELSPGALDEFDITLPPGSVSGEGRGDLQISLPPGEPPQFVLSSDLVGLRLSIPPVSWTKPPGQAGAFEIAGRLGAEPVVDRLELSAPGLDARGSITLLPGGAGLQAAVFDRVDVGDWLTTGLVLTGRGADLPPAMTLRDGFLDLRRAQFGPGEVGGEGPPLDVGLQSLVITDQITLTDLRAELTTTGGATGRFQGRVNGGAQVTGVVEPTPFGPRVRLRAQDGGAVIRDAGIFRQVRGGTLSLTLDPRPGEGVFDGDVDLSNIRVEDAPAMAALLSAISVVGLFEQLDGGGLVFNEVDGKFRIMPGQVVVTEGSATGASLGISVDGIFDTRSQRMDFQGVISPLYLLNGIGSIFTRRGEGLIGFNFTLQGSSNEPSVSVNPFSILTPGMFREIFRRPPPQVSQ